ncbi:cytidylyltransferase domain-containing protein [Chloroflexota bacterium]
MIKNVKIVAVIQVRMKSTRLPGKVLKNILGKPMLWHLVTRVQKAKYIDDVVIATTVNEGDNSLEEFTIDNNLGVYRGSENDLVDRFFNAGKKYQADITVRVWGDCPLIDPDIIDKVLLKFIGENYDYANNFHPPTYPSGMNFEVYSLKSLERIWKETSDIFYREYPFEFIYANHNSFKTLYDHNEVNLSNINLTVDYIEDFEIIAEIFRSLYQENEIFHMKDILEFIEKHPKLSEMNKDLERNTEYNRSKKLRGGQE